MGRYTQQFLVNLSRQQQENSVGKWCYIHDPHGDFQELPIAEGIISQCCYWDDGSIKTVTVFHTGPHTETVLCQYEPEMVQVRNDVPRAYNSNGYALSGEWEDGYIEVGGTPDGSPAMCVTTNHGTSYVSSDSPVGEVRRFVGQWEQK